MMHPGYAMAIDAGGTYFKYGVVSGDGSLYGGMNMLAVNSNGTLEEIMRGYAQCIGHMRQNLQKDGISALGLGISTPGPFDFEHFTSRMEHKFASLKGINLREEFIRRGILSPCEKLRFIHDAHAFLLGECRSGAAAGFDNVIAITIGTGLGVGYYLDGVLRTDVKGGPLYSLYALPFGDGVLENLVSAKGITAAYCRLNPSNPAEDAKMVAERARKGDTLAAQAYALAGEALAQTLGPLVKKYRIDCVVFGGQVSHSADLFFPAIMHRLSSEKPVELKAGLHLDASALVGAAQFAFCPPSA